MDDEVEDQAVLEVEIEEPSDGTPHPRPSSVSRRRSSPKRHRHGKTKKTRSPKTCNVVTEDAILRHVQDVLELGPESRERMRMEGITRIEHLFDIEHLLRENKVKGLLSVETVKLLQFLSWVPYFQTQARGTLPNVQADFSVEEYNRFVARERASAHTHVWPFLGLWEVQDDAHQVNKDSTFMEDTLDDLDEEQIISHKEVASQEVFPGSARLRENFLLAEEAHRDFHDGSGRRKDLKEAIEKYRLVVDETVESVEDCMVQAFACVKLGVLLSRVEFRNQREATEVMKKAAVQFKMPAGMFFYGFALVTGNGGVVKDVPRGIGMLNDAGAAGIGEAYFVLGNIYEGGADGIHSDLNLAKGFYVSSSKSIIADESNSAMRAAFEGMTSLFQPKNLKMPALDLDVGGRWRTEISAIKGMMISEGWQNAEGIFVSVVGERFNWGLAGQAFLVGAAVVLTQTNQANHYPALLPLVPILGMMLAFFSLIQTMEVIWRNSTKRRPVRDMHAAKLKAFGNILKVRSWHRIFIPPLHYFVLLFYQVTRLFLLCCSKKKKSEELHAKIIWVQTWGYTLMIAFVTWLIESECWVDFLLSDGTLHALPAHLCSVFASSTVMVLLLALTFFATWLILLYNEGQSHNQKCSDWWSNTCQGSQVRCNEEETLREECPLYSETPIS